MVYLAPFVDKTLLLGRHLRFCCRVLVLKGYDLGKKKTVPVLRLISIPVLLRLLSMDSNTQFNAYTPLPEDWTVVEESLDANVFQPNEVVPRSRFSVNIPTTPISTTNMSFTFSMTHNMKRTRWLSTILPFKLKRFRRALTS